MDFLAWKTHMNQRSISWENDGITVIILGFAFVLLSQEGGGMEGRGVCDGSIRERTWVLQTNYRGSSDL